MHGPSLLISKSSVKVVRHKIHISRCGKQGGLSRGKSQQRPESSLHGSEGEFHAPKGARSKRHGSLWLEPMSLHGS
jgi:hypothetical protein